MNNEQLQGYFHFDEVELNANRNGNLSQKQRERLASESGMSKTFRLIIGIFLFGFSACLVFFIFAIIPQIESPIEKIIWPSFIGLFILLTVLLGLYFISGVFKKTNMNLEKTEGPINIVAVERSDSKARSYTSYALYVGKERFWVTSILANYIMQGDIYTVYFVRGALKSDLQFTNIMSIENNAK